MIQRFRWNAYSIIGMLIVHLERDFQNSSHYIQHLLCALISSFASLISADQSRRYIHVQDHDFIKNRFQGLGKSYALLGWWVSEVITSCLSHLV